MAVLVKLGTVSSNSWSRAPSHHEMKRAHLDEPSRLPLRRDEMSFMLADQGDWKCRARQWAQGENTPE